jgi:ribosome-binding factor A
MASHARAERVGQQIQEVIAAILTRGLNDPRIGFVTITGVKVPPDLKTATVFYSFLGDEKKRKETEKGLAAATGYLQHEVAVTLKLRSTPRLRFVFDESVERGDRIERLLKQVKPAGDGSAEGGESGE